MPNGKASRLLIAVTRASAMEAPERSSIVPRMVAVFCCPCKGREQQRENRRRPERNRLQRRFRWLAREEDTAEYLPKAGNCDSAIHYHRESRLGSAENHGELLKLGFDISERSVSRYLRRVYRRGDPETSWLTFLRNHREMIVALDFFTVPTVTFHQLYCLFVIEHGRRRILYCNVTRHPTADWVLQQLREAFPEAGPYRYATLDRDTKFDTDVINFLKSTGLKPKRTSVQAPWQNGIAERWIGSCRRELLDHIIALNEWHLLRLVREYVTYHHDDRIHDSLDKDCPCHRVIEHRPGCKATVTAGDRDGGLHHRYFWHIAA